MTNKEFYNLLKLNHLAERINTPGKRVNGETVSGVRIPSSPQITKEISPIHNIAKCC